MPRVRQIAVREARCSGCLACEIACVVHHERCFGTAAARLRVLKDEEIGLDRPRVCQQCSQAPCAAACPTRALERDEMTRAIRSDEEACTGCGSCVAACSFDGVALHPRTGRVLICDLCGGDPACVKRCATGAITLLYDGTAREGAE